MLGVGYGWTWQATLVKAIQAWNLWGNRHVLGREECQQTNPCEGLVQWWKCKLHCINSKFTMDIHAINSWWWLCCKWTNYKQWQWHSSNSGECCELRRWFVKKHSSCDIHATPQSLIKYRRYTCLLIVHWFKKFDVLFH